MPEHNTGEELLRRNPHLRRLWRWARYPTGIHPWRWRALGAWVLFFTLAATWAFHVQGRLLHQGQQAHDALCGLQLNLQLQISSSYKYLREVRLYERDVRAGRPHPRGRKPIAGITTNDILAGIKRSQLTLASLHDLRCVGGQPVPPPHDSLPPPAKTVPGTTQTMATTTVATTTTTGR